MSESNQINLISGDPGIVHDTLRDFLKKVKTKDIYYIDKESYQINDVTKICLSSSMFDPHRIIIIRDVKLFDYKKVMERIPANNIVIVVDDVKKNTSLYDYIDKNGKIFNCDKLNDFQMQQWITDKLKSHSLEIDTKAAKMLAEYGPEDTLQMKNEVDKLISYVGKSKIVKLDDIQAVCQADVAFEVFGLLDVLNDKNITKALTLFNIYWQEEEGKDIDKLLSLLQWQFRLILMVVHMKAENIEPKKITDFIASFRKVTMTKSEYNEFVSQSKEEKEKIIKKFPPMYKPYSINKLVWAHQYFTVGELINVLAEINNLMVQSRTDKTMLHIHFTIFLLRVCKKIPFRMTS